MAWTGTAAALVLGVTVTVSAQTPTSGRTASTAAGTVTVAGCLQGGTGSTTGTTATARPGSSSPFLLTNVTAGTSGRSVTGGPAPAAASAATATSRTSDHPDSTTNNSATTRRTYVLDGFDTELAQHVGHRIEVTGTLSSRATASSPASPSSANTSSTSSPSAAAHLEVTGVRMVASTCSGR